MKNQDFFTAIDEYGPNANHNKELMQILNYVNLLMAKKGDPRSQSQHNRG